MDERDYLKQKFIEIEILKGKLFSYPKECSNDIIVKLCMICDEVSEVIDKGKDKILGKKDTDSKKEKHSICGCKEKNKQKHTKESKCEVCKDKKEKDKDKCKDKVCKSCNRGYYWSRELLKDLDCEDN